MRNDAYADRTIAAYRSQASAAIANWSRFKPPSRFLKIFAQTVPRGGRILDYGCGIGLEMRWLKRQKFQVEGVEGSLEFVRQARRYLSAACIRHTRFETVRLPTGHFDGIWANASLMHVPPAVLLTQLEKLQAALKPGGWLGMTLAWGKNKGFVQTDWIPGRYIAGYQKAQVRRLLRGWQVSLLRVVSGEGRKGRWIQLLVSSALPGR